MRLANVIGIWLESSLQVTNRQPVDYVASIPVRWKVKNAIYNPKPRAAEAAMRFLLNDAADRIVKAAEAHDDHV